MDSTSATPTVSIITATYRSPRTLRLTLESLRAQDFEDFEVWVIGDACQDQTAEAVAEIDDPRFHWFNRTENSGSQGAPNNEGLQRARGKYIAYLGHDDLWFPWHLSKMIAHLEGRRVDLVHSLNAVIVPQGLIRPFGSPPGNAGYDRHFVPPSSWMHRASLVPEIGLWADHTQLSWAVDEDYLWRICRAGKIIECCRETFILKFPSAEWKLYQARGIPPQAHYLAEMRRDARMLERSVLADTMAAWASHTAPSIPYVSAPPEVTGRQVLRFAVGFWARRLLRWYGYQRWPVSVLRDRFKRHRYQRARENRRQVRGLSD
jgi:glycosyltransferase involved in cell wall biosynthesis